MGLKTDKIQLEIIIKGDKVRKELLELETTTKKLAKELKKLPEDTEEFTAKFAELKKAEARMEELRKEIGLTGMTMRELRNRAKELSIGLNNIDPRTPQYKAYRAELDQVNARMRELKGGSEKAGMSFSKMADGFNKYMGVIAAVSASLIGVVLSMRKMVDSFDEYEQKVANLSAITGLAGDDLQWLSDKAKELSTSTTDSGVKITKSADDIVDAFTKVGSKRPELLANKEAMAEVTKQALILAEAGQMELEVAIDAVTASMNQFNLGADQSERIINTLAAGSLEGSAEVDSLAGSLKNVGTVADNSNLTLEQTVAALEVLASKQLQGEEAGTKFRGALLKMKEAGVGYQSGVFNMRDALIETNSILAGMGSQMEKDAAMQKIFGTENVTVGTILLNNIDAYDKLTQAVTNTDTAVKQATTNTSTHKAELEQAKNRAHLMAIEMGEKLAPIMTFSTNTATMFLKVLMKLPEIVQKNKVLFIALGAALLAYNAAKLKGIAIKIRDLALMRSGFTLRAKEYVQYQQLLYQEKLAAIQKNNLGKSVGLLKGGFQKLWAAISMNPLGALIIAAGAAIAIFTALKDSFTSLTLSQKKFNEANQKAAEYAAEQRSELGQIIFNLKHAEKGSEAYKAAIDNLNKSYGKYLPNLLTEKSSYKDIVKALLEINKQIELKAKLQAYEEMLTEAYKEQAKVKMELEKSDDRLATGVYTEALNQINTTINDFTQEIAVLRSQQSAAAKQADASAQAVEDYSVAMETASESAGSLSESTKAVKSEYEKLNEEISKYEKLLKDQVVTHDANAAQTAKTLQDLKDQKDAYDQLIEKLENAAYIQSVLNDLGAPTRIESRPPKEIPTTKPGSDKAKQLDIYLDPMAAYQAYEDAKLAYSETIQNQLVTLANESQDVIYAYAQKRINREYNDELAALESRYARGQIDDQQYNDALVKLNNDKEAKLAKAKRRSSIFEKGASIAQLGIDTYKSVGNIQAKVAEITAAAALNPLLVPSIGIAASQIPIVIAGGIAQAALMAAKPIPEYAMGRYPVLGKSGRKYNASWAGIPGTGIYDNPTLGVFGEKGRELLVDYPTLRTLEMRSPEVITEIYRAAGKVKEYADGKYPEGIAPAGGSSSDVMMILVQQNNTIISLLTRIDANGQNVQTYKDLYERLDEEKDRKNFIKENYVG